MYRVLRSWHVDCLIWLLVCSIADAATRKYDFTISRGMISPDGTKKLALLVNNQYPGPTIEANWKDTIEVTVHNRIAAPGEGTSLHWHGFFQKGTPWSDGVPAVNQCPIPPGDSYTYSFVADQYGTSWYHSHFSAQYTDGALGPIVIHGPKHVAYDVDLGPIVLTDWFRTNYTQAIANLLIDPPIPPKSANNLINGKSFANYSDTLTNPSKLKTADISNFSFQTGKTHLLRFVNGAAEGFQHVSIDNHLMTVVAVDFTPIEPYNTTVVTLGAGQRTEVLVRATGASTDSYWLRANMSATCSLVEQPYGLAAIHYPRAKRASLPHSTAHPYADTGSCLNDPLNTTVPLLASAPATPDPTTLTIDVQLALNASGAQHYYMNNVTFVGNLSAPILGAAYAAVSSSSPPSSSEAAAAFPPAWNVLDFGRSKAVRLVLTNSEIFPHPLHLHGHAFWVMAEGRGVWDGTSVVNPRNPTRRDTHMLGAGSPEAPAYAVLQFEADNPGVWPFHCHAAWHLAIGMMANILEGADRLKGAKVPRASQQLCESWREYKRKTGTGDTEEGQ